MDYCKYTGKVQFKSYRAAIFAMAAGAKGDTAFLCKKCSSWHTAHAIFRGRRGRKKH